MTRLQTFLRDNPPSGQDGIDLYNRTYFCDVHPAITTRYSAANDKFIMERKIIQRGHGYNQGGEMDIAPSVTTSSYECNNVVQEQWRIRKLTPKECFRLMGVADTDSDKIIAVLSKSRCYQVAGNSIVVDVLAAIFDQLFNGNKNTNQQTELF